MNSAKFEGVAEDEFVRWSLQDPDFAGDEGIIRRKWHSLSPRHAGALWAALSERGYKLKHALARNSADQYPFIDWVHTKSANTDKSGNSTSGKSSRIGHHLDRIKGLRAALHRDQREPVLFSYSCLYAEILFEQGNTSAKAFEVAQKLLEGECPDLIKAIGIDAVRRAIRRGFAHVEAKMKEANNAH
jgi:hypothetical protein